MSIRQFSLTICAIVVISLFALPAIAQDDMPGEIIAEGLLNPRNMAYDSEGNLYIAEAGTGGSQFTADDSAFGATSQVSMLSPDGSLSVIVKGLISYREGNSLGAHAVLPTDESLWVLIGETSDFSIPYSHGLLELDKETGRIKNFIDLLTLELEQDPDGNPNMQSNPVDFAVADDGTIYIANAGCNCLMSWTAEDGVQVPVVWPFEGDNPVPTNVEIGPDGDIYVSFLTGFPWPDNAARIERWSDGELVQTYEGLTAITGLLVNSEGRIFAVEQGTFDQGWSAGRVVEVTEGGLTTIVDDLSAPFGVAETPDGDLIVSVGTTGGADGAILRISIE